MTRAPGRTLHEMLLRADSNKFSEADAREFARPMLQAMQTLHTGMRLAHRDAKLENVLIATLDDIRRLQLEEKEFERQIRAARVVGAGPGGGGGDSPSSAVAAGAGAASASAASSSATAAAAPTATNENKEDLLASSARPSKKESPSDADADADAEADVGGGGGHDDDHPDDGEAEMYGEDELRRNAFFATMLEGGEMHTTVCSAASPSPEAPRSSGSAGFVLKTREKKAFHVSIVDYGCSHSVTALQAGDVDEVADESNNDGEIEFLDLDVSTDSADLSGSLMGSPNVDDRDREEEDTSSTTSKTSDDNKKKPQRRLQFPVTPSKSSKSQLVFGEDADGEAKDHDDAGDDEEDLTSKSHRSEKSKSKSQNRRRRQQQSESVRRPISVCGTQRFLPPEILELVVAPSSSSSPPRLDQEEQLAPAPDPFRQAQRASPHLRPASKAAARSSSSSSSSSSSDYDSSSIVQMSLDDAAAADADDHQEQQQRRRRRRRRRSNKKKLRGRSTSTEHGGSAGNNRVASRSLCATDNFSVGVALFLMLTGRWPFNGRSAQQLYTQTRMPLRLNADSWRGVSDEAQTVVKRLLASNYRQRWTAREALESAWLKL